MAGKTGDGLLSRWGLSQFSPRGLSRFSRSEKGTVPLRTRRAFLRQISAAGLAATSALTLASPTPAAEAPAPAGGLLPTITLGKQQITRLVAGWNPIGGHSHTTLNSAREMREYFTVPRIVEFLEKCEKAGVSAWQYDHTDKAVEAIRISRQRGSQLKLICLHAERTIDTPLKTVIDDTAPIAVVHHGGVTDSMFRVGQPQKVHDFVKKVHDQGLVAGVSAHNPDNIKRIADEGWENDFFMTCFYYVTRPREEQEKLLGKVAVGEPFFESDPVEMTKLVRQVQKPCLGFKILAAGRTSWTPQAVDQAFQFAFKNIKPSDGVIVGLFPKYYDEISEDAMLTRKYGTVA